MVVAKRTFLKELRNSFFFLLVSVMQAFLMCPTCSGQRFLALATFTFFMWVVLWKGNTSLSGFLSRKISWTELPLRSFIIRMIVTITYTILAVLALMKGFEYFSGYAFREAGLRIVYGALVATILISLFIHGRQFLMSWRKASFEKEIFEKESIAAKYEALKNQVSPHFLFNSLNTLTNLVYEDQHQAVSFIKQLSEVYRYVLETREKEVVPVTQELRFLNSYLYLQQIRFGKKLNVTIGAIPENILVPPLALQMLIENAIKHNVVSEDLPLTIRLYSENGFLVVENNLQRKSIVEVGPSPGLGLANICKRYEYLSNTSVQIVEDAIAFIVRLPVLEGTTDENPNH